MSGAAVSIQRLSKAYGDVIAVADFSLSIAAGEFVSILGQSGSGKTTVLKLVAGLEEPSSGEIYIDGRPTTSLPPEARDIGMVFQDYALFPHMSVWHNIAFPLRMRGYPRNSLSKHVAEAMDLVNLTGLDKRMPTQLSGGQQQRVALGRSLVFGPKLLLLDEPLSALDKNLREYMKAELKSLHRRVGVTVIYVTHDQSEALALSDRIVVMHEGRIEGIDAADRLYEFPPTRYIAGFVGDANLFDGRIVALTDTKVTISCKLGVCDLSRDRVRANGSLSEQMPITLVVRPEAVLLGRDAPAGRPVLVVDCQVAQVLYGGVSDLFVLKLRNDSSVEFTARGDHWAGPLNRHHSELRAHILLDRCGAVTQ